MSNNADHLKEHQFGAGNPGGPGRPKGLTVTSLIRKRLEENDGEGAQELADALIEKAKDGNSAAIREVVTRMDGPVPQHTVLESISSLTDEERAERLMAILNRAQERRDAEDASEPEGSDA